MSRAAPVLGVFAVLSPAHQFPRFRFPQQHVAAGFNFVMGHKEEENAREGEKGGTNFRHGISFFTHLCCYDEKCEMRSGMVKQWFSLFAQQNTLYGAWGLRVRS